MPQRSRSTDTSLCNPFTTMVPSTCGNGRYTNHQIPVPAAITRIKNIESKPRRTLRKLFLSHYVVQPSVKDGVSSGNAQRLAFVCCYNAAGDGLAMFVLRLIGVLALIALNGFFA